MRLKIKIKIDDDRMYRSREFPYTIHVPALRTDIDHAINRAIGELQFRDFDECEALIIHDNSSVGKLKVTLDE